MKRIISALVCATVLTGCNSISKSRYALTPEISNKYDQISIDFYPQPAYTDDWAFKIASGNQDQIAIQRQTDKEEPLASINRTPELPYQNYSLMGLQQAQIQGLPVGAGLVGGLLGGLIINAIAEAEQERLLKKSKQIFEIVEKSDFATPLSNFPQMRAPFWAQSLKVNTRNGALQLPMVSDGQTMYMNLTWKPRPVLSKQITHMCFDFNLLSTKTANVDQLAPTALSLIICANDRKSEDEAANLDRWKRNDGEMFAVALERALQLLCESTPWIMEQEMQDPPKFDFKLVRSRAKSLLLTLTYQDHNKDVFNAYYQTHPVPKYSIDFDI